MTSTLLPEHDVAPASRRSATIGSQRLLQRAVNHHPELLNRALAASGAVAPDETVEWLSPLENDEYREYRDMPAIKLLRVSAPLHRPLNDFWPPRGPVWDGLGISSRDVRVLVEAKAHLREAESPGSKATPDSLAKIRSSLHAARAVLAPGSNADWCGQYYQYANRLAFQLFLTRDNHVPSVLVFLHFTHAEQVRGPESVHEWHSAIAQIHHALGLPHDLSAYGVHHAFLDARLLAAA